MKYFFRKLRKRKNNHSHWRTLVVDDNQDAATSFGELVSIWGHEVRIVYDGQRTLEVAHSWKPQVILLDIGPPGMDGTN